VRLKPASSRWVRRIRNTQALVMGRAVDQTLLNVAVTHAKEALDVVGNRQLWRMAEVFRHLDSLLA
jgi:superfamily I DNA and/or RNA helicase